MVMNDVEYILDFFLPSIIKRGFVKSASIGRENDSVNQESVFCKVLKER